MISSAQYHQQNCVPGLVVRYLINQKNSEKSMMTELNLNRLTLKNKLLLTGE
jgi:hypothetical protein